MDLKLTLINLDLLDSVQCYLRGGTRLVTPRVNTIGSAISAY